MALTTYSVAANFLHPVYRGKRLSKSQLILVEDFLITQLDNGGLDSLNDFIKNCNFFSALKEKNVISSSTFWGLVENRHSSLSKLAQRLLNIPASSAQLERIFSNWAYILANIRNRLTQERSSKLVSEYYALKMKDTNSDSEY